MIAYARTDTGRVRQTNQDNIFCSTKAVGNLPNLFIVADGMGGRNAGDYASSALIEELLRLIRANTKDRSHIRIMRHAIENANLKVYMDACSDPKLSGMGTTLVTAMIEDGTLYVSNVGDSRLYIINEGIRQVTTDHSYVEEMIRHGKMVRGSEDYRKSKNIITRAVGIGSRVDIDFFEVPLREGDRVLLCTDGLTNMIDDEQIASIVRRSPSVEEATERLIRAANERGGSDNISVVLVSWDESEVPA